MSVKKLRDWRGWLDGLRSKAMRAGAEAVVTNLTSMIGSNGVASMIPALHDYALGWHTALLTTGVQFGVRTALAAATYVMNKPDPDIIEKDFPTEFITKQPETKP